MFKLVSEYKPTLVLAHNKPLAGQLYSEFKEFFPEYCVELANHQKKGGANMSLIIKVIQKP